MRFGMRHPGGTRSNALWGRGGRRVGIAAATMGALLVTSAAAVGAPTTVPVKIPALKLKAYVPDSLRSAIQQNPRASYDVIVQGDPNGRASLFFKKAFQDSAARGQSIQPRQIKRQFLAINGGRASLT